MSRNDLAPYQIYVLQLMAQPADAQLSEYIWDADEIPLSLASFWTIAFTGLYRGTGDELLPGLSSDINEIDEKRRRAGAQGPEAMWTNAGLRDDPFWEEMRNLARLALKRRGITVTKPDPNPDTWYKLLPAELH